MFTGLPSLSKKLVAQIIANKYVDFAELPPAKGKVKAIPQVHKGQIVVVQAADLYQHGKIDPRLCDLGPVLCLP